MEFFVATVRKHLPRFFSAVAVLEIGSYDVNGSVRKFFADTRKFVGVDLVAGPGVDIVASGHQVKLDAPVDVAISTECFEHNPHYLATFANMVQAARPGGLVLFTCASTGRPEHGTSRTSPIDSPGTMHAGWDYYRNLDAGHFAEFPLADNFAAWRFFQNPVSCDLYFFGLRHDANHTPADEAPFDAIVAELTAFRLKQIAETLGGEMPVLARRLLVPTPAGFAAAQTEIDRFNLLLGVAREDMAVVAANGGAAPSGGRFMSGPIGRNEPCPCGSGKRYKHCHGQLN
jgi:SAM-dependent methyltransferase